MLNTKTRRHTAHGNKPKDNVPPCSVYSITGIGKPQNNTGDNSLYGYMSPYFSYSKHL